MCIRYAGTWHPLVSVITTLYVANIFHRRVVLRTFSVLYDTCIRFFHGLHCWASPWRKIVYSITHSVTQLIWCTGNWSLCFGKDVNKLVLYSLEGWHISCFLRPVAVCTCRSRSYRSSRSSSKDSSQWWLHRTGTVPTRHVITLAPIPSVKSV